MSTSPAPSAAQCVPNKCKKRTTPRGGSFLWLLGIVYGHTVIGLKTFDTLPAAKQLIEYDQHVMGFVRIMIAGAQIATPFTPST